MEVIKFSENYNNKLNCIYFTSVRYESSKMYKVGAIYKVYIADLFIKKALLLKVEKVSLFSLSETDCYIDGACGHVTYVHKFEEFYPHVDVSATLFSRLLFKSVL
jgi:hypothetical protein